MSYVPQKNLLRAALNVFCLLLLFLGLLFFYPVFKEWWNRVFGDFLFR